jgi:hypothetical protein
MEEDGNFAGLNRIARSAGGGSTTREVSTQQAPGRSRARIAAGARRRQNHAGQRDCRTLWGGCAAPVV